MGKSLTFEAIARGETEELFVVRCCSRRSLAFPLFVTLLLAVAASNLVLSWRLLPEVSRPSHSWSRLASDATEASAVAVCPAKATRGRASTQTFACDGGSIVAGRSDGDHSERRSAAELVRLLSDEVAASPCSLVRDPWWQLQVWPPPEPAVLTNVTQGWAARGSWSREQFLQKFGDWRMPLSTFLRDPWMELVGLQGELTKRPVDVSFEEYLNIRAATQSNVFLFVRDELGTGQSLRGEGRRELRKRLFDEALGRDYTVPPGLNRTATRIFAMDGLASGHGMHRHGEAWLASLAGRKVWWVAPPLVAGDESTNSEGRPVFPYKDLSSEEGGWPCSWLLKEDLVPRGAQIRRCVQQPGEVVVLPAGWWHMTCSLDEFSVAVGGQGA
ncbi:unnamed protein product [Polarella glacialis]|uniref:JmjC domain-containing protein n=1 Tax=Polarella glacialis TaxID=89957 RepID=A0A813HQT8_POLGL|nr:unnamed protein product [Polarella glacialis]CAE8656784.1 unnamed protein product [Polarella glacialis]|mmetsp:Transcript_8617/g.13660  ORF Transcript_8617/g.13660 Transcript_8617/m.13660 type:complete len:386 (-) Transcript_8617:38-1195(-)